MHQATDITVDRARDMRHRINGDIELSNAARLNSGSDSGSDSDSDLPKRCLQLYD